MRRRQVRRHRAGLTVDVRDVVRAVVAVDEARIIEAVHVVLRVGVDPVVEDAVTVGRDHRAEALERTARGIESVDGAPRRILDPQLPVDRRGDGQERLLRDIVLILGRDHPRLDRFRPRVEPRDPALMHHREPQVAAARIVLEVEAAGRKARFEDRRRVLRHLAARRIERSDELLVEVGEVDFVRPGHDDVVRRRVRLRQIVLGDEHVRRGAFRARHRLERVRPGRASPAEVDPREVLGDRTAHRELLRVGDEDGTRLLLRVLR